MKFSANLGFLFTEVALLEAIDAAAAAGFDAVEFHWPYEVQPSDLAARARDAGVAIVSLNTVPGGPGSFGLGAVPGREADAAVAVRQAVDYAAAAGIGHVHLMAGIASGPAADAVFRRHLELAAGLAEPLGVGLLVEPINPFDVPGYFLASVPQAMELIDELELPGLRLMFDCYHVARIHGDVLGMFTGCAPRVGHVQFASVPDRAEPDHGEVDYRRLLPALVEAGWNGPFGAEYRPAATTTDGLSWLHEWRRTGYP